MIYNLATDAAAGDEKNPGGFGAVLSQAWEDGSKHVISYASRALKKNEETFSAYLLELAAAAWTIDHFSVYLRGRQYELFMDHQPLESLSRVHQETLNRLQKQMYEFDFKINYKKGSTNTAADALLRNTLVSALSDNSGDLVKAQANDPFIRDVSTFLLKGVWPDNTLGYRSKVERCAQDCLIDKDLVWINIVRPGRQPLTVLLSPSSLH